MKLSILIPCYNERETIGEVIRRAGGTDLGSWDREIIVVDDGSADGSREILDGLRGTPGVTVIFHEKNRGKGAALATAENHATGDYVIVQDADLELVPEEIPRLLARADRGEEAVYGTRNVGGENPHPDKIAAAGVWFLTKLTNLLYGTRLTDVWNGFKLVRRDLLAETPFPAGGFEAEILFTAALARRGIRILEVPVSYHPRKTGTKKITYRDGLRTVWALLKHWSGGTGGLLRLLPHGRIERFLFWGTLAVSLAFFAAAVAVNGGKILTGLEDWFDYPQLAKNLYEHGVFSETPAAPFAPASTRTPLLPLMIGLFWVGTGKSLLGAYLGMEVVNALLAVYFFRFVKLLLGASSAALIASLIFMFEPVHLYTAMNLYPEVPILILLIGGLLLAHRFFTSGQPRYLYGTALLWGFTPLLRPVTQAFIVFLPFLALFGLQQWRGIGKKLLVALAAIILFALPELPWLYRNYRVFNQITLSSLPEHQIAGVLAPYFMAWKEPCAGCDREQAIIVWRDKIASDILARSRTGFTSRLHVELADAPDVRAVALPYIAKNLGSFALFLAPQAIAYPLVDSWRSVLHNVFGVAPRAQFPISFPARLAHGDLTVIREAVALGRDPTFYVFIAGKLIAALLAVFSIIGFVRLWRSRRVPWQILALIIFFVGYFSLLAVPTYELRYRTYILPFLTLCAAAGICRLSQSRE